jgi:hypothetical protein
VSEDQAPDLRTDVPHGARIWNYWLGGKDNFPADRAVGDAVRDAFPMVAEYALKSRQFLVRAVRHLAADAGITQFLDIGTGLPTMQNTHEVAQALQPTARVVYVDNDPWSSPTPARCSPAPARRAAPPTSTPTTTTPT